MISKRDTKDAIVVSKWPKTQNGIDKNIINEFEVLQNVISGIRNFRKKYQISFKESLSLSVVNNDDFPTIYDPIIRKLCNVTEYSIW